MGELFSFSDTSWLTSSDGQHKLLFDLTANNTHLDLLDANTIRCLTGAPLTERLRIAADGRVGIGTSSPDRPLTVQGSGGTYLNVKANGGTYEVLLGADAAGGIVSTMTNHDLQLRAGGNSTKVTLKANGNVGIGTGDPGYRLDVGAHAGAPGGHAERRDLVLPERALGRPRLRRHGQRRPGRTVGQRRRGVGARDECGQRPGRHRDGESDAAPRCGGGGGELP